MIHKHLLIKAEVLKPPKDRFYIEKWLLDLVNKINMVCAAGPISSYVTKKGNEGLTAAVLIETSHISIHVWDKADPALIQFDLYSCKDFNVDIVLTHFSVFNPVHIEYMLLDRNEKLERRI